MHLRLPQNIHKDIDLPILALYPLVPFFVSLNLSVSPILSVVLFSAIPCIYLSFRLPHRILRSALFSLVLGLPFMFIVSYIANSTGQWTIPTSIAPRILGFIPIEELIWAFLNVYYVIMFYLLFFEGKKLPLHKHLSRRFVQSHLVPGRALRRLPGSAISSSTDTADTILLSDLRHRGDAHTCLCRALPPTQASRQILSDPGIFLLGGHPV